MDLSTKRRFISKLKEGDIAELNRIIREGGVDAKYMRSAEVLYEWPRMHGGIPDYKRRAVLKILLEAGANVNSTYMDFPFLAYVGGLIPNGNVEMLLKAGADPNVSFRSYGSVLDFVVKEAITTTLNPAYRENRNITALCEVTNYDEVERLKKKYPEYADLLNCQMPKASMGAVETALDRAAAKMHPELQDGVELPHVMKNVKEYVGYKNVGPGGRRMTKKRKSYKKKTKKRK